MIIRTDADRQQALEFIACMRIDPAVEMTVVKYEETRTALQNRYYFGVVIPAIKNKLRECGMGNFTKDEIHHFLATEFLPESVVQIKSKIVIYRKSTASLSIKDMCEYVDSVIMYAGSELGLEIPPPNYEKPLR